MAAPVRGPNGRNAAGEPLTAEAAAQAAEETAAAERATSSVLALDGWGRLEAEPHTNGATLAEPEADADAALDEHTPAEPQANSAMLAEPPLGEHATAEPQIDAAPQESVSAESEPAAPPSSHLQNELSELAAFPTTPSHPQDEPSAQSWEPQTLGDHAALDDHAALGANAAARAARLPQIELDAVPGLRLLGPALIFGLALGALVGAVLRWLELRNTPPPPPTDPAARLRRRLTALQEERANEIAQLRRRLHTLGVAPPPPPPPEPTIQDRLRRLW